MSSDPSYVEFNVGDLRQVAASFRHHADALESAHGGASGIERVREAISKDITDFTHDRSTAPIYAGMRDAVNTLADNQDSNVKGLVTSLRAWGDYFEKYADAHSEIEAQAVAVLRKMTGESSSGDYPFAIGEAPSKGTDTASTTTGRYQLPILTVPHGMALNNVPRVVKPDTYTTE